MELCCVKNVLKTHVPQRTLAFFRAFFPGIVLIKIYLEHKR